MRYVAIDDPSNRQSIPDNLAALMAHYGARRLQYQHPDEWRLDAQLREWSSAQPFVTAHMPGYESSNGLGHTLPLPSWFWTGETRMRCLQHAVGQSLESAHAHHIQRLMIIGNFALLAGLDPAEVHRWYLGVYIDAFEWVEIPNTVGMSQFADGGRLATKPYVSSAAYIDRMSDYCKGCPYDRKLKVGDRACPYNALYWDFFARHAPVLRKNVRLSMVYRQLQRMEGP